MSHVLVTGGGGYVGSVLVPMLLESGARVTVVDRFFFGMDALRAVEANPGLTIRRGDVRDITADDLVDVTAICDLASLSNDPAGEIDPGLTMAVNRDARIRVACLAREVGIERYIIASSCSVYGGGDEGELVEDSEAGPLTTYARAAFEAEQEVIAMRAPGFSPVGLRFATIFGVSPRMRFDLVVNLMVLTAVEKARIIVMGGGNQWRPLIHVRDVARAYAHFLDQPDASVGGQVFNVGHENFQVMGLAYAVREALPFEIAIDVAPDDADARNYRVSFDRARALGFEADITVADGASEIYQALKAGMIRSTPRTSTVNWYRHLLEAKETLDEVMLDGRLF